MERFRVLRPSRDMILTEFYAPMRCALCGRELGERAEFPLCSDCRVRLEEDRLLPTGRCPVCFGRLDADGRCSFCSGRNVFFDSHRSLFRLSESWHRILRCWKFENGRDLWRLFLPDLRVLLHGEPYRTMGRLCYIDSGRSHYHIRNYQPCEDLAREAALDLGWIASGDIVKSGKAKQSARGYSARFFDIAAALKPGKAALKGVDRCILLEDLFTTGATANEAARLLKRSGVDRVDLVTMLYYEEGL